MTSYCTVNDIAVALNIEGTQDDGRLTTLADSASRWIDERCGLPSGSFAVSADSTRRYDVGDLCDGELKLDLPLISLTSLTNADGTSINTATVRLLPVNGPYYWSIRMLSTGPGWQWVTDGLFVVTGKFGRSTTPPAPIKELAIMLTAWMYKKYQAGMQDVANNAEIGQMRRDRRLPDDTMERMIAPFCSGTRLL